ncbi:hypothetical protein Tco_0381093 [Tanacetum coccineum]
MVMFLLLCLVRFSLVLLCAYLVPFALLVFVRLPRVYDVDCLSTCALFPLSFLEQLPYVHVHWPEVPWKQSLYLRVYLEGAAILAARLSGNLNDMKKDVVLLDVTPRSFGIRVQKNAFRVILYWSFGLHRIPDSEGSPASALTTENMVLQLKVEDWKAKEFHLGKSRSYQAHYFQNHQMLDIPKTAAYIEFQGNCRGEWFMGHNGIES